MLDMAHSCLVLSLSLLPMPIDARFATAMEPVIAHVWKPVLT
jgi:hypothetical protein